ncbi:MAG: UvrD-helicase domain-containing protein [Marinilabiliales bacterium]|nr:UvrD-helicase domain-containing protein [Marinilabiliales bacterium]
MRYSASAGSGKTHALTGFYLSRVLLDPGAYRRILAVTFTNSAAAEMKSRILKRLAHPGLRQSRRMKAERNEFVTYLCKYFPDLYPDPAQAMLTVRKNAPLALKNILQDYSRFTVGTIDSFFQRVIRAFAREIEVPAGYEMELEHEALLSDAVDGLLAEVATDRRLLEDGSHHTSLHVSMTTKAGMCAAR